MYYQSRPVVLRVLCFSVFISLLFSCNRVPDNPWTQAIPESATFVYVFNDGTSLDQALNSSVIPFLNDTGFFETGRIREIQDVTQVQIQVKALFTEPADANRWAPVFIGTAPEQADYLAESFSRAFTENTYQFNGLTIHRLYFREGDLYYLVQLGDWLVASPHSRAIEATVRSFTGSESAMSLSGSVSPEPGAYFNFPKTGSLARQLGAVRFRPNIKDAFNGLEPAPLSIEREGSGTEQVTRIRAVSAIQESKSSFIDAISKHPASLRMDRYIPSDVAVYGMLPAGSSINVPDSFEPESGLDSLFTDRPNRLSNIASAVGGEIAFAGFHTLGFSPLEETVFIRHISDRNTLRSELERLSDDGYGLKGQNTYTFRSSLLARTLGSDLCPYQDFVVGITGDVVILAPRTGLIQRVRNDISQRRVLFYDDDYLALRRQHPEELSGFFYADNQNFRSFIEPFTDPAGNALRYANYFDIAAISVVRDNQELAFSAHLHQLERRSRPFADRWYYPFSNANLTGPATIGNLFQESRNDIVFATTNNRVIALASDGTELFTVSTGQDRPIGSPILFDWYANNQTAILIAAGNKVYGWNNRGQLLPNFPFELSEDITSPLLIADVSRSGQPEAVVATADRQLHVLTGRGNNLNGWPQTTNSVIRHQPVFEAMDGRHSIWAFSENAIFGWNSNGNVRDGFPVFADAPLTGKPVLDSGHLFAGGADGKLYAVTPNGIFDSDIRSSLEGNGGTNSFTVEAVEASSSPLRATSVHTLRVPVISDNDNANTEQGSQTEIQTLIAAFSDNGSVFLYDKRGRLRFTQSAGRPLRTNTPLIITDLNRDNKPELLVVTEVGRMYAWTVENGTSFQGLPSTAVHYPLAGRLGADGLMNIIAGTRDGIRSWALGQ